MNVGSWALWGFVATLLLTTVMTAAQGLRLTRMSLPYMLGSMITPSRDAAKLAGFLVHLGNGWLFSLLYVAAFQAWGRAGALLGAGGGRAAPLLGAAVGLAHAAFVLTAGMLILPGLHPRMASEAQGPDVTRQLEPPGFLGLHYGGRTPLVVVAAHLLYGAVLGGFYRVAAG